jgi:HlyD family secretion protein
VTIPIQALTMRDKNDLDAQKKPLKPADKTAPAAPVKKENTDLQGVFVVKNKKAEFHEVVTGLTGSTEIQVKSGLEPGDEIITGSYKVLKTLRNGAGVKVDNSVVKLGES